MEANQKRFRSVSLCAFRGKRTGKKFESNNQKYTHKFSVEI
jgi:hypothetical protein